MKEVETNPENSNQTLQFPLVDRQSQQLAGEHGGAFTGEKPQRFVEANKELK